MRHQTATIAVLTDEYQQYSKLIIDQIANVLSEANFGTLCLAGRALCPVPSFHQDYSVCNAIYTAACEYELSGIIFLSGALATNTSIEKIEQLSDKFTNIPQVSFGLQLRDTPSVIVNETKTTTAMYEYLLGIRRAKKLAFISGGQNDPYSRTREQIFRESARKQGHTDADIFLVYGNFCVLDTYDAVVELLTKHPDIGIIAAANDVMAESATRAAQACNLNIPSDILITGFDDTKEATRAYPALTTVRQPLFAAATHCAELMLGAVQQKQSTCKKRFASCIEVESELIIRESTSGTAYGIQPNIKSQEELIHQLNEAMSCLTTPDKVCLQQLGESLWISINSDSNAIDTCLQRFLHLSPPCVASVHWWNNVCHKLHDITTMLCEGQTSIGRMAVITEAIAAVRQHIWAFNMNIEFERRRATSVRTTMQLQMSSCVKQSDILDTMSRWLGKTLINRCYLVRYVTPGPTPDRRAQLLHAYVNGSVEVFLSNYFYTYRLLPDEYEQEANTGILVQAPVYAGEDLFGYLLIDPSGLDHLYLDEAAQSIGNALRNQHLIEKLEQQTGYLRKTNKELVTLANNDELTKLPNRLSFNTNLKAICETALQNDTTLALLFIDLDGFKLVNDTLGHRAGDDLLRDVAERLRTTINDHIGVDGFIARLGGDEFTITITGISERERIKEIVDGLLESLSRPYTIAKRTINISASIGIADFPTSADNVENLIKNADSAMYRAKEKGKNCASWYTAELSVINDTLLQMDNDMRIALLSGDICMHYQPRVNMNTNKLSAVEALMRWTIVTPEGRKTRTRPDVFIDVAEKTGFITQLDMFALDESCRQARAWELAGTPLLVAVNISVLHLQQDDFVESVLETLARYELSAHLLELEITESAVMTQVQENVEKLHRLRNHGIQLSIDDFGTGYSSLSYLKQLPVNNLKIDKSFIADIHALQMRRSADAAIIKSVIALGKSMEFQIIAEGIETEPQREFLRALGCHEAQGYLFARPAPAEDISTLLKIANPYLRSTG